MIIKSNSVRISRVAIWVPLLMVFSIGQLCSQTIPGAGIQFNEVVPGKLLSSRSVLLYTNSISQKDLIETQKAFQQIGIDAIACFSTDIVMAGKDITKAYSEYFVSRQITYILFLEKPATGYRVTGVTFDQLPTLYDVKLPAWRLEKARLNELLRTVFQDSWRSQKKNNYLVNEYPETDIVVDPFKGNRKEFYAIDLKVDNLAVPKFGNEAMDKELEEFFKTNYPLKYKLTEAGVPEPDLRKQGYNYVLCYVHTTGKAAKEVLGYDMTKVETNYASITFPSGQLQLKTIPAETNVYKFYFRHIDNGNVFLGTKWDADLTWQEALKNHIQGFKVEAKIN